MLEATFHALLFDETIRDPEEPTIYVVRDETSILYVGKTTDPVCNRLWRHLEGGSYLGLLYLEHRPISKRWRVEMYTVAECESQIRDAYPDTRARDLDTAEQAMIRALRP